MTSYDIAVIVLEKEVVPNNKIQIASLPEENAACPTGKNMMISGWGDDPTRPDWILSQAKPNLYAVMQECLSPSKCPVLNYTSHQPNKNLICVGDAEDPSNSACVGDSGGKVYLNIFRSVTMTFFLFMSYDPR